MAPRLLANGYPVKRRRRGIIDNHQRGTYAKNRSAIVGALKNNPATSVREIRRRCALNRRTVRKHVEAMRKEEELMRIGRWFMLQEDLSGPSHELNRVVERTLKRNAIDWLNFSFVANVGGCYLATSPNLPKDRLAATALFEVGAVRFARKMFWLEDMVAYALKKGDLSRKVYSKTGIDIESLKQGLKHCFGDTRLLVLAFAVDLQRLLDFLTTPFGQSMTAEVLGTRWDSILEQAGKNWLSGEERRLISSVSYED